MKKKELVEKLKEFDDNEEVFLVSFSPQVSCHDFIVRKNGESIILNPTRRVS